MRATYQKQTFFSLIIYIFHTESKFENEELNCQHLPP